MNITKPIKKTAAAFSAIFTPLLAPTYAIALSMWFTCLSFATLKARLTVLAVTFAFTCMLPVIAIFLLHRSGIVKDPMLNERRDRFFPYIVSIVSYIGVAVYFSRINAPTWLPMFLLGSAAAAIVTLTVNMKWKISGHSTGMGGLTAFLFFLSYNGLMLDSSQWLFVCAVLLSGIVMSSRLILDRHTPAQVIAGFFNGALWITISQLISI